MYLEAALWRVVHLQLHWALSEKAKQLAEGSSVGEHSKLLTCCKLGRTYLSAVCSSDKGCCSQVGAMSSRIASISVCKTRPMRGLHPTFIQHGMALESRQQLHRVQAAGGHSMQRVELPLLELLSAGSSSCSLPDCYASAAGKSFNEQH